VGLLFATRTDFTLRAMRLVRDPHMFKWYAVALLAFVIYAYANEVERARWDVVAAGIAIWLADWFNEIINALVLHATNRAALWTTTGPTAYQFLIGLNVEIMFMFALAGIVYVKLLPGDRRSTILKIPNRLAVALGLSITSVAVESSCMPPGPFTGNTGGGTSLLRPSSSSSATCGSICTRPGSMTRRAHGSAGGGSAASPPSTW
jgi:hypothetical protein